MEIIFETSLGNGSETAFEFKGERILNPDDIPHVLSTQCSPYRTGGNGKIVYVSDEEYDKIKDILK